MNKILTLIFFVFPLATFAQKIDYNKIILPDDAKDIQFVEKLVRLAWANNPINEMLKHEVAAAEYNEKIMKRGFINQITATGNLNEFNINPPNTTQFPIFFPRYNFGATLNLGNFFLDPLKSKKAKEEKMIAVQNVNSRKLTLRAEVLRKYQIYLTKKELLKVQVEALEDASNLYSTSEQKFKNGEATIVEYNAALENLNSRKTQKITAELDFNVSKIDIEELIGVKLEDVI